MTNLGHFEIFTKNRDLAGQAGWSKNGRSHFKLIIGEMVRTFFAKITDVKRFLCFLMIKNTPAESPWDNHKSFGSTISITTVAAAAASTTSTKAAETFVVIPGTFPFSWSVF